MGNGHGHWNQHLARARQRGSHTSKQWYAMQRHFRFRCVRCQKMPYPNGRLTKDHILAVSLGGSDSLTNLQPLCSKCNSKKGIQAIDYRFNGLTTKRAKRFIKYLIKNE